MIVCDFAFKLFIDSYVTDVSIDRNIRSLLRERERERATANARSGSPEMSVILLFSDTVSFLYPVSGFAV